MSSPQGFARGPVARSGAGVLGIYAESSSAPSDGLVFDPDTGEVKSDGWSYAAALVERYALQAQARKSMLEQWYRDGKQGKAHRVTRCRRWLRPRGKGQVPYAEVYRHVDTGRAFFSGTEICASAWACPVCSAKIAERRAEEIRRAVDAWIAEGGICLFVTLTVPHELVDALAPMVQRFRRALQLFRGGRGGKAINDALASIGLVRAMETTWGDEHGFHPHSHEIWFCRPGRVPLDDIIARWQDSAQAAGFQRPHDLYGVRVKVAESSEQAAAALADYLTKLGKELPEDGRPLWGVAEELAKAHSKRGRFRSMTPFDFLRAQYDPQVSPDQRARFRELFAEYVAAFKGVAQVYWSRGLKARFEVEDRTDEETAEESRESADRLARLDIEEWERLFARRSDHRASLLIIAQNGGADALRSFVDSLPPLLLVIPHDQAAIPSLHPGQ